MTPVYDIVNINQGSACAEAFPLHWIYRLEPATAASALIGLFQVVCAIGIAIVVLLGRSPLIRHTRVGWRGVPLPLLKVRTMWEKGVPGRYSAFVEDISDSVPASRQRSNPRVVSKFAAICRRYCWMKIRNSATWRAGRCRSWGRVPLHATNSISTMLRKSYNCIRV
jgi:hypothetical protein